MKYLSKNATAFTSYGNGLLAALTNQIEISEAHNPATNPAAIPQLNQYTAIWDTGATNTCISKKVAADLGLQPSGMAVVTGVHGPKPVSTYLVNVYLPNNVGFVGVRVTEADEIAGANVLIGMDIIRSGDFAVSNYNGRTIFSFRVPSLEEIDFRKEIADENKRYAPKGLSVDEKRKGRNRRKSERRKGKRK